MKIKILLNEIEKIKRFIEFVHIINADVDLVLGRYTVNAKSVMGIYSLDLTKPIIAEIYTDDKAEISHFEFLMEEFRVD